MKLRLMFVVDMLEIIALYGGRMKVVSCWRTAISAFRLGFHL
ncbi:MAG: hypothetical protein JSC189_000800 [Candidatus Tokpelaia sp. JSC189]|nr:MAG: hypothetical protein JSC189_000800 [Candidatus Tokpelaia sp. JSC189]